MKNQYFGDIIDYRKYGLLRVLNVAGLSVGVCWMLTADDDRLDGLKTSYLQNPHRWRHYDPPLFDFLKAALNDYRRSVVEFEKSRLLDGLFSSSILTTEWKSLQ